MKKVFLSLLLVGTAFSFSSCIKDGICKDKTPSSEEGTILNYASTHGITATAHSSGIYYQIITQGTGPAPTATSLVKVNYKGRLMNDQIFDQTTTDPAGPYTLNSLIKGWQIGLPLINEGGNIRLIIPSSLGYGCKGYGPVPSNSVLYFEIDLVDVL